MAGEEGFIDMMRALATHPGAQALADDVAVLSFGGETLILTHDMMVEDVHWPGRADPADIAWKLVSANLSDLAAKGAEPVGLLLGYTLGESAWDRHFAEGLRQALDHYAVPLLGGDTVGAGGDGKRTLGMTALGRATHMPVPSRSGAIAGDILYLTGPVGDARAGFEMAEAGLSVPQPLADAFNRPVALLEEGRKLAPQVHAMMDVSDGLLIDARHMADASGLAIRIDLSQVPLSGHYVEHKGQGVAARLEAASWGDDYQLLFAAPAGRIFDVPVYPVGQFSDGSDISLHDGDRNIPLPPILGFSHR